MSHCMTCHASKEHYRLRAARPMSDWCHMRESRYLIISSSWARNIYLLVHLHVNLIMARGLRHHLLGTLMESEIFSCFVD